MVAALAASLSIGIGTAQAASGDVDLSAYVANGPVNALARGPDGSTYIGGEFSAVGPRIGSGMILDPSSGGISALGPGEPDSALFPEVAGGQIRAVTQDGSGGWYIGGDFEFVGAQPHVGLAHIDSSGTVDGTWSVSTNAPVHALSLSPDENTVYAGGQFTTVDGQARNRIVAITATGSVTAWNPDADGTVRALAVSANGASVYAGGVFANIGGAARNRIAALTASDGTAIGWDPNANGPVNALALGSGLVYAGGSFSGTGSIGGADRNRIAALDASTGVATGWDPNASGAVEALTVKAGLVYAGGSFSGIGSIGGADRNHIAALDPSTGAATSWNPNADGAVRALAIPLLGGTVYAGGDFSSVGGEMRNHVAALDLDIGSARDWNPNTDGPVNALAVSGDVYVGGDFVTAGAEVASRSNLARLNPDGTVDTGWSPAADAPVHALSLSPDGNTVYAGGQFTTVGGQARNRIAAIDDTGIVTAWDPGADGTVRALAVSSNGASLYAGGEFANIGGAPRNRIAALAASDGTATGWDPNANGPVNALALSGNGLTIYAGGSFSGTGSIGGADRNRIAALDAGTGAATGWNPDANGTVETLVLDSGLVYAGGSFSGAGSIGGADRNRIAALDAGTGAATGWNPDADGTVRALAIADAGASVYAGGDFLAIGGQPRNHLASMDAGSGLATAWDPDADMPVNALAASSGIIYAGGEFSSVGEHATAYFAQIDGTRFGFSVSPASKAFGGVVLGQISAAQVFTVTSTGIDDLEISDVSLAGPDADQFAITAELCTAGPIAPTLTCTVAVQFEPTSLGAKVADLSFTDNASDSPQDVALTGTGAAQPTAPPSPASPLPTPGRAPETAISSGPQKTTGKRKAAFKFSSDSGSLFECSLDRGSFKRCGSPMRLKGLRPGKHVLLVRAVNAAGVADGSPARYGWKVKVEKKKTKKRQ